MTGNERYAKTNGGDRHLRPPLRFQSLLLAGIGMAIAAAGCQETPRTSDPEQGLMVFVDMDTQQPVVNLATTEVPAVNPDTGKRTLMPGLYCPSCRRWHPSPAYDKLQRSPGAGRCPDDGTPLTSDGPWPTGDQ